MSNSDSATTLFLFMIIIGVAIWYFFIKKKSSLLYPSPPHTSTTTKTTPPQKAPSGGNCSSGWNITGYFNPKESDYPGSPQSVNVQGVGTISLSSNFMKRQNVEGMGLTHYGWYLGGQNSSDYHKVPCPEDGMNPPGCLKVGYSVAVDPKVIPLGTWLSIPSLPSPWNSYKYRAVDTGVTSGGSADVAGKHIDVFVGDGLGAEQETFRITGSGNQVCLFGGATANLAAATRKKNKFYIKHANVV